MFTKSRIFILILTLVCFVVWLGSDLIKTPASFTPSEETQKALLPLNSDFDQNALTLISKSNSSLPIIQKVNVKNTPTVTTPSPTPSPSPKVASSSATPKLP